MELVPPDLMDSDAGDLHPAIAIMRRKMESGAISSEEFAGMVKIHNAGVTLDLDDEGLLEDSSDSPVEAQHDLEDSAEPAAAQAGPSSPASAAVDEDPVDEGADGVAATADSFLNAMLGVTVHADATATNESAAVAASNAEMPSSSPLLEAEPLGRSRGGMGLLTLIRNTPSAPIPDGELGSVRDHPGAPGNPFGVNNPGSPGNPFASPPNNSLANGSPETPGNPFLQGEGAGSGDLGAAGDDPKADVALAPADAEVEWTSVKPAPEAPDAAAPHRSILKTTSEGASSLETELANREMLEAVAEKSLAKVTSGAYEVTVDDAPKNQKPPRPPRPIRPDNDAPKSAAVAVPPRPPRPTRPTALDSAANPE